MIIICYVLEYLLNSYVPEIILDSEYMLVNKTFLVSKESLHKGEEAIRHE